MTKFLTELLGLLGQAKSGSKQSNGTLKEERRRPNRYFAVTEVLRLEAVYSGHCHAISFKTPAHRPRSLRAAEGAGRTSPMAMRRASSEADFRSSGSVTGARAPRPGRREHAWKAPHVASTRASTSRRSSPPSQASQAQPSAGPTTAAIAFSASHAR